jgi:hypothetical protein
LKILKQSRKTTTVELDPVELEILRGAIVKEANSRNRTWKQVDPKFPEELMYHAVMQDTADKLKAGIYKLIQKYRDWGILK